MLRRYEYRMSNMQFSPKTGILCTYYGVCGYVFFMPVPLSYACIICRSHRSLPMHRLRPRPFCANSPCAARVRLFFYFALASYPQYDIIAEQRVPIAQLDRASDSDSEGRRFESFWARHMQKVSAQRVLFSFLWCTIYSYNAWKDDKL